MTDLSGSSIQSALSGAAATAAPGTHIRGTEDYKWQLDGEFAIRLQRFLAENPHGAELLNGYRDDDHQNDLVGKAKDTYGDDWRKWAAPAGKSNHGRGVAGDIHYLNDEAQAWAHDNAHKYGLEFPMGHEPWHVEPLGLRSGGYVSIEEYDFQESYTIGPYGSANPADLVGKGIEGSVDMLNTLMTGALPPADSSSLASDALGGVSVSAASDQALSGPGEQPVPDLLAATEEETDGNSG